MNVEKINPFTNEETIRRTLIRNSFLALLSYTFPYSALAIGHALGVTATPYSLAIIVLLWALVITLIAYLIIKFKKRITKSFVNIISFGLFVNWLITYGFSVFYAHDVRKVAFIFALDAIIILISYAGLLQALVVSFSVIIIYLSVVIYGIEYHNHEGDIAKELFFSISFLPVAFYISYMAKMFKRQRKAIKRGQLTAEQNRDELATAMEEMEAMNTSLIDLNRELEFAEISARRDMRMAINVQSQVFPQYPPQSDSWDVAFLSKPMTGVTGDFYDFYIINDIFKGLGIFDVSGHGVASALIALMAKSIIFRSFNHGIREGMEINRVMENANNHLIGEIGDTDNYITGLLLNLENNSLEYVNAGHHDIIYRREGESFYLENDDDDGGYFLGFECLQSTYSSSKIDVISGDVYVLFTDSFVESKNKNDEQFGVKGIMNALKSAPVHDAVSCLNYLTKSFYTFTGTENLQDDLTVIVLLRK